MAGNPTAKKRQREALRQEQRREKAEKRELRKVGKESKVVVDGEDPDIAGIIPGPQPIPTEEL